MRIRTSRLTVLIAAASLTAALLSFSTAPPSSAAPSWAPAPTAAIRPGVNVSSSEGSCTSNFIFFEPVGSGFDVFIGAAAHCFSLGGSTSTNGCTTPSLGLGAQTTISGASFKGFLAYSSWLAMKAAGESNGGACAGNDFALIKISSADVPKVNPSVKYFGGPVGLRTDGTSDGERVASYGNSTLRFGLSPTSPKRGVSLGTNSSGWTHLVYTASAGIPGDSGSGFLDMQGRAFGVLATLQLAPYAGGNGVADLAKALAYANAKTGRNIQLATGTLLFADPLLS